MKNPATTRPWFVLCADPARFIDYPAHQSNAGIGRETFSGRVSVTAKSRADAIRKARLLMSPEIVAVDASALRDFASRLKEKTLQDLGLTIYE
jgi:hypothetical protein